MGLKGKKRETDNSTVGVKLNENQQPLKKKLKVEKTISKSENNGVGKSVISSNNDIKNKLEKEGARTKTPKNDEKSIITQKEAKKDINEGAKLAAILNQKAKRKEKKQKSEEKWSADGITATVEELEKTLENILNRDVITKTARRRIAVLKKKILIKKGMYKPSSPTISIGKNQKRKLRMQRLGLKLKGDIEDEDSSIDEVKTKANEAADAVKGIKAQIANKKENGNIAIKKENKVDKNIAPAKEMKNNKRMEKNKKTNKVKVVVKPEIDSNKDNEDDEDDEDDEEDEEEEIIKNENANLNVSNNSINNIGEDDEDDDDDENENEDEDEDEDDDNDEDDANDGEEHVVKQKPKHSTDKSKNNKKANLQTTNERNKKEKSVKNVQNENGGESQKKRYVLFVGNLPYSVTSDEIKKHFLTKVNEVVSVRIPLSPENKSRGFAYVEFSNNIDFEKGLSMHQSNLNGRRISVQYSQSGSKAVGKRPNVVAKNKKLHALRKQGKLAGSTKDSQKRNARRNKGKTSAT